MIGPGPSNSRALRRATPILLALILLAIAAYCYPFYFQELTHSYRQIYTYNLDSMILLRDIQNSFYAPKFHLDFTAYGQLYYNLSIALTALYSLFAHPSAGDIFLIMRLTAYLGIAATIVATFLFARFFFGTVIALFCVAALALNPTMVQYAIEPHPDSWQMFFVSLSLFLCAYAMPGPRAERGGVLHLPLFYGAVAAGGAAFSTKYIGVLLLPMLLIGALAPPLRQISVAAFQRLVKFLALGATFLIFPLLYLRHKLTFDYAATTFRWQMFPPPMFIGLVSAMRWGIVAAALACLGICASFAFGVDLKAYRQIILRILVVLSIPLVFALAFALTSPWAWWKLQFLPSVYFMGEYVNYGHGEKAPWFGFHWLTMLSGSLVMGVAACLLAIAGAVAVVVQWKARRFAVAASPLIFVVGWALFFAAFMIVRINLAKQYYLMPMVPATVVLAGAGLAAARDWLARRMDGARAEQAIAAVSLLCLAWQAVFAVPVLMEYRRGIHDFIAPEKQKMADWLLRCVPPHDRIMTSAYSYIPAEFDNAWLNTDQGGYNRLATYHPDVVILTISDIVYYQGSMANSVTNLLGETDDKVRYFNTVAHSRAWAAGPAFGVYRIFLKPALHDYAAGKGCL